MATSALKERATLAFALAAMLGGLASLGLAERATARTRPGDVAVWVAHESEKVLPSDPAPKGTLAPAIALDAAGQDCAGAQIAVRPHRHLTHLRAFAEPLHGPGAPLPVSLSRVATITLTLPSGPDGRAGEWPDALIPDRDALFHEPRHAFPTAVGAGRTQAIFVEVCAQAGAAAGVYLGAVRLSWSLEGKKGGLSVPLQARVRGFDLPATPPLATAFGFSGYSALKGHGKPATENLPLTRLYDRMALARGITLFGGTQDAPSHHKEGERLVIDWTSYDAEVAPFLDGTALPSGAHFSSVELREPGKLTRDERRQWRQEWGRHFQQRGWLDRLFIYVQDEPAEAQFDEVQGKAAEYQEDLPQVRRLLTTALSERLPAIDLWTPVLNCFDDQGPNASCARPVARGQYQDAEKHGAKVWWYQSCASHGCGKVPATDGAFRGWPSYAIDAPSTGARAMGALAFANGLAGELYYDVVFAYGDKDPWVDQWEFGGNGDGTLYYPGTPARIGGEHDVPVESLRIVQIARSLADHSALTLCGRLGDPALANKLAHELAPGLRSFSRDPRAYSKARSQLYDRIEQLGPQRKPRAGTP